MDQHFDKTISTLRLVAAASADTERYSLYLSSVPCQIQPLDDSSVENLDGSAGKDFLMFSDLIDIKQEDKVNDGGTIYLVVGVEHYNFVGKQHTESRIRLAKWLEIFGTK